MNLLPLFHQLVDDILSSSERPEATLLQRYQIGNADQRLALVTALVGALIVKDRLLKSRTH